MIDSDNRSEPYGMSNTSTFTPYTSRATADMTTEFDPVNRPEHYANTKVECIDAMEEVFGIEAVKHFCLCNAFKYHWRASDKNGQEDLEKADWYMRRFKELVNR